MAQAIPITLDGKEVAAHFGETLFEVAARHGVRLPNLCLSQEPDFHPEGNCRLCMVEVEGRPHLQASCVTRVAPGMRVMTESPRARAARRLVMELLLAEARVHPDSDCARWAEKLGVTNTRFPVAEDLPAADDSHPGIAVELAACIRCMRCLQACREVELYDVIGMAGRGVSCQIVFDLDNPMGCSSCVSCGSCAQTCPTGALKFRGLL